MGGASTHDGGASKEYRGNRSSPHPGKLRRIILAIALVMLVVAIAAAIFLPGIAAGIIRTTLQQTLAERVRGQVSVEEVSLSWFGPQQISQVVVLDEQGAQIADLSLSTDAALLPLALGNYDLGEIRLNGELKIIRTAEGEILIAGTETAPSETGAARGEGEQPIGEGDAVSLVPGPINIPTSLAFIIKGDGLKLLYESRFDDGSPELIGVVADRLRLALDGREVDLDLLAKTLDQDGQFTMTVSGEVSDRPGVIDVARSSLTSTMNGQIPASLAEVLAGGRAADGADEPIQLQAGFVTAGGVLGLNPQAPIDLAGPLPRTLISALMQESVLLSSIPDLRLTVPVLSVPLEGSLETALLEARLTLSELAGTYEEQSFTAGPVAATASFDADPRRATFQTDPIQILFGNGASGTLEISADIGDFSDTSGVWSLTNPGSIEARVVARNIPGEVFDLFAEIEGVRVERMLEGPADITVLLAMRTAAWLVPVENVAGESYRAPATANQPVMFLKVESAGVQARVGLGWDVDRFVAFGPGIDVLTTNAQALIALAGLQDQGDIRADRLRLTLLDFDIPLQADLPLGAVQLSGTLEAGSLIITDPEGEPVHLSNVNATVQFEPGSDAVWTITANGTDRSARFTITGEGAISGLSTKQGIPLAEQFRSIRPRGTISLEDLPTVLARLVSPEFETTARAVFGDVLRGSIDAMLQAEEGAVDFSIDLAGPSGQINGEALRKDGVIRLDDTGLSVTTLDATSLQRSLGIAMDEFMLSGGASLRLSDARIPLEDFDSYAPLRNLAGLVSIETNDLMMRPAVGVDAPTTQIESLLLTVALDETGSVGATWHIRGATTDRNEIIGDAKVTIAPIHSGDGVLDLTSARITGDGGITGFPRAMLRPLLPQDLRAALDEIGEEKIDLALVPSTHTDSGIDLRITSAESLLIQSSIRIHDSMLWIERTTADLALRPALFETLLSSTLDELTPRPSLRSTIDASMFLMDTRIPLKNRWLPAIEPGVRISGQLRAVNDFIIDGALAAQDGTIRSVGNREFSVGFTHFAPDRFENNISVAVTAFLPEDPDREFLVVRGSLITPATLRAGELIIERSDLRIIDDLLGYESMLTSALGENLRLSMQAGSRYAEYPPDTPPITIQVRSGPAQPGSLDVLSIQAFLDHRQDQLSLWAPARVLWVIREQYANTLLGQDSGLRVAENIPVDLEVHRVNIAQGEFAFGREDFEIGGIARAIGPITIIGPDDSRTTLQRIGGFVRAHGTPAQADFQFVSVETVEGGERPTFKVEGLIDRLGDAQGRPTPDQAIVRTLKVLGSIPTAIIDAAAQQQGGLVALLGPAVQADIVASDLSRTEGGGTLDAKLSSVNANTRILADVRQTESGTVLHLREESDARLTVISPQVSENILGRLLPLIASFEKTPEDQPVLLTTTGLNFPMDSDLRSLNGSLTLDLGTLRFQTIPIVARLLEATKNRPQGLVGERLEPITLNIENGVARYERFTLPLGEYNLDIEGGVDLVTNERDLIIHVPLDEVSESFAREVRRLPLLGSIDSIPFRFSGTKSEPRIELALDSIIAKPEDLLNESGDRLLRDLFGLPGRDGDKKENQDSTRQEKQ